MKYSTKQFASKIKEKYPAYENVEDKVLVEAILKKHPEYKDMLKEHSQVPVVENKDLIENQPTV